MGKYYIEANFGGDLELVKGAYIKHYISRLVKDL